MTEVKQILQAMKNNTKMITQIKEEIAQAEESLEEASTFLRDMENPKVTHNIPEEEEKPYWSEEGPESESESLEVEETRR